MSHRGNNGDERQGERQRLYGLVGTGVMAILSTGVTFGGI
jgi:hypothetical protein